MAGVMEQKEKNWTFQETEALIREYEKYPCLYNFKMKEYKDKMNRKAALEAIAAALGTTGDEVNQKFQRLRTQYNRERGKATHGTQNNGSPRDDARKCKVTWGHYESLHFLKDFTNGKASRNVNSQAVNESKEESDDRFDEIQPASDTLNISVKPSEERECNEPCHQKPRLLQKDGLKEKWKRSVKRKKMEEENLVLAIDVVGHKKASATSRLTEKQQIPDADDVFGQYVACELRSVEDKCLKSVIKHKINTILFEAQMSTCSSASLRSPIPSSEHADDVSQGLGQPIFPTQSQNRFTPDCPSHASSSSLPASKDIYFPSCNSPLNI